MALAVAAGAAMQSASGLGLALVAVPVLGLVVPGQAAQVLLLVGFPVAVAVAVADHRGVDLPAVGWLSVGRTVGAVPGALLVATLPVRGLQVLLAVLCAASVVVIGRPGRPVPATAGRQLAAGTASGVMATAASIGGPPLAWLFAGRDPERARGTINLTFVVGNVVSLAALGAAGQMAAEDVHLAARLLLPLVAGLGVGALVRPRVDAARLRRLLAVVVAVAAGWLALQALRG